MTTSYAEKGRGARRFGATALDSLLGGEELAELVREVRPADVGEIVGLSRARP